VDEITKVNMKWEQRKHKGEGGGGENWKIEEFFKTRAWGGKRKTQLTGRGKRKMKIFFSIVFVCVWEENNKGLWEGKSKEREGKLTKTKI
jgi:hypothetical protein